ncbi:MAG: sulfide/dihydroorotate dehydrogenase-like FAD/NAD-binding protein [Endomicrobiales bacterium]
MFKITAKKLLAPGVKRIEVEAPDIARHAQPGQFIVLRLDEKGERIPLTIAGFDAAAGTVTIIFQEVGKTTAALGLKEAGDAILDIVGPLGQPTEIENAGTVVTVSGGVGTAEVLPVARALRAAGNKVMGIIGARNKDLLILQDEMQAACDRLLITTDDGSAGQKGFVSNVLENLIAQQVHIDLVYAIGPVPMMKAIAALTRAHGIKTMVSLNPIMVDGTGMCGACRVTVDGKTRFACVDGPEFDGHQVNWDELITRLSLFKKEEKQSFEKHGTECKCRKE